MHGIEDRLLALFDGGFPVLEERSAGDQAGVLHLESGLKDGFETDDPGVGESAGGGLMLGHVACLSQRTFRCS